MSKSSHGGDGTSIEGVMSYGNLSIHYYGGLAVTKTPSGSTPSHVVLVMDSHTPEAALTAGRWIDLALSVPAVKSIGLVVQTDPKCAGNNWLNQYGTWG